MPTVPMNWIARSTQLDLLNANTNWFSFFSSVVTEGKLRIIGCEGIGVLAVLKTFADWKTSKVRISNRELSYHTKLPINRLRETIDILIEQRYIDLYRERPTGIGEYTIYDLITPRNADTEEEVRPMRVEYRPHQLIKQRDFIKESLRKGYFPEAQAKELHIHFHQTTNIEKQTINNNNIQHNGTGDIHAAIENQGTKEAVIEATRIILEANGFKLNKAGLEMLALGINATKEGREE